MANDRDDAMLAVCDRWWNDVWCDGDLDALTEMLTDPFVRHTSTGSETVTVADYRRRLADTQRALAKATTRIDDRAVVGDRVWTRATSRGVNRETGDQTLVTWLIVQRFDGDRIAEHWVATVAGVDWGV